MYLYQRSFQNNSVFISRAHTRADRLTKYEVEEARSLRMRDLQMWSIIQEVLTHLCFLWILYTLSYSNRNENAFRQVNHLRQFFLNLEHDNHDYTKVKLFFFLLKIVQMKDYIDRLCRFMIIGIG